MLRRLVTRRVFAHRSFAVPTHRILLYSTMTTPVASTSQPAQLPALQGPHANEPAQAKPAKEKKDKATASGHPLEVSY